MLYVVDGGIHDNLALAQLIMRRQKRILCVLAGIDAKDDLGELVKTIQRCIRDKYCTFYVPNDMTKSWESYFDEFKKDKNMRYLHLGIRYGWKNHTWQSVETGQEHGHLVIVKNRLRNDMKGKFKIEPLIKESDVTGKPYEPSEFDFGFDEEDWEEISNFDDLGGFWCCDRCHVGSNDGTCFGKLARWPDLSAANYLWMSPMIFNGLARLGHNESDLPIETVIGKLPSV
jgi:hypothetical protein